MNEKALWTSTERRIPLQAFTLDAGDLVKLFLKIQERGSKAAQREIETWRPPSDMSSTEIADIKHKIENAYRAQYLIQTPNGQRQFGNALEALAKERLPDEVERITFGAGTAFGSVFNNLEPKMQVRVILDFKRPQVLDITNPASEPTPNDSHIELKGVDLDWIAATESELCKFFIERVALGRKWINGTMRYDLLLWLIWFPLILRLGYLLELKFGQAIRDAGFVMSIGVTIMYFLMAIFPFRFAYAYLRWVWPHAELVGHSDRATVAHRFVAGIVSAAVVSYALNEMIGAASKLVLQ